MLRARSSRTEGTDCRPTPALSIEKAAPDGCGLFLGEVERKGRPVGTAFFFHYATRLANGMTVALGAESSRGKHSASAGAFASDPIGWA